MDAVTTSISFAGCLGRYKGREGIFAAETRPKPGP